MKKFITKIMIFVMFITSVPIWGIHTVNAAPALQVSLESALGPASFNNSNTPVFVPSTGMPVGFKNSNKAVLNWAIGTGALYDHELTYYLDNGRQVVLNLSPTISASGVPCYQVDVAITDPTPSLLVYEVWLDVRSTYVAAAHPELNSIVDLNPISEADRMNSTTNPSFTISQNKGFSFRYGGVEFSFLWDGDIFRFGTDGLSEGNIYDFTLNEYIPSTSTPTGPATTAYALTKLVVKSAPTAVYNSSRVKIDQDINFIGSANPDYSQIAGDPGLEITVNLPRVRNAVTNMYSDIATAANYGNITAYLDIIDNYDAGNSIFLTVGNLLGGIPTYGVSLAATLGNVLATSVASPAGTLVLNLTNDPATANNPIIKPSLIYDGSCIDISQTGGTRPVVSKKSYVTDSVGIDSIYTFLKYEFIRDQYGNSAIEITPYRQTGYYAIFEGNAPDRVTSSDIWIVRSKAITGGSDAKFSLSISIPSNRYYQVRFSPDIDFPRSNTFRSQIVGHSPMPGTVGPPALFEVYDYELKSTTQDNSNGEVDLWLRWDIGSMMALEHLIPNAGDSCILTYQLRLADNPTPVANFTQLDEIYLEVTRVNDTTINVSMTSADFVVATAAVPISAALLSQTSLYHYIAQVKLEGVPAHRFDTAPGDPRSLSYPGIHFLSMALVEIQPDISDPSSAQAVGPFASLYKSFTLSALDEPSAVPAPQNLKAYDPITDTTFDETTVPITSETHEVSFKASWDINGKTLNDYVKLVSLIDVTYDPLNPGVALDPYAPGYVSNLDVSMNLYISQVEKSITDFMEGDLNYRLDPGNSIEYLYPGNPALGNSHYNPADGLVFSAIGTKLTPMSPANTSSPADARTALRNNGVVRINVPFSDADINALAISQFSGLSLDYLLDGLDKNQQYYVCVDIVVTEKVQKDPAIPLIRDSISTVAAITTKGDPDVPSVDDKVPPAPDVRIAPDSTASTSVTIEWDKLPYDDSKEIYEYEIIRLRNEQMGSNFSGDFDKIFESDITAKNLDPKNLNKLGWATDYMNLMIFDEQSGSFRPLTADEAAMYIYDYNLAGSESQLTDSSLTPNQLYFYYVRTKKMLLDASGNPIPGSELYSSWEVVNVTSKTVTPPRDLKLGFEEYHDYFPDRGTDYDRRTDLIISFEAPATAAQLDSGAFTLYYSIKEDGGEWSDDIALGTRSPYISTRLVPPPNVVSDGHTRYLYKLSGLNAGKGYSIRIRIEDESGSKSLYTTILVYRTNMDQDEFDDEKMLNDWNDYLQAELEKLLKDPYYTLTSGNAAFTAWYRPSMMDSIIISAKEVTIKLDPGTSQKSVYIIPQSALIAANKANKGFKVTRNNLEISIPPKAINTPDNSVIKEMDSRIRSKNIADYYIAVTITWGENPSGSMTVNNSVRIEFEAVGSTVTTSSLEKELGNLLATAVENIKQNVQVQNAIKDYIKNDQPSEDVIKYINSIVGDVKNRVASQANARFLQTTRGSSIIQTLDAPMFISIQSLAADMSVNGYYYDPNFAAGWRQRDLINVGTGKGLQTVVAGLYGFDVRTLSLPNIDAVQNGGRATEIVAKYGLDTYLGQGAAFNLEANLTKDKVVNSVAAIMGMPKGGNGYDFLKSKGYTISSRNGSSNIQTQEAIYITMILYEVKTNTKVSAIQIRNQAATAGITGIDNAYKQSIKAAFELGIYTNNSMKPTDPIKLKDFLQMLVNLDGRVRL